MANLQVKNVPEKLHRELRALARRQGRTLRDLVLEAVEREVQRARFMATLRTRAPVDLGGPAAELVIEARRERETQGSP